MMGKQLPPLKRPASTAVARACAAKQQRTPSLSSHASHASLPHGAGRLLAAPPQTRHTSVAITSSQNMLNTYGDRKVTPAFVAARIRSQVNSSSRKRRRQQRSTSFVRATWFWGNGFLLLCLSAVTVASNLVASGCAMKPAACAAGEQAVFDHSHWMACVVVASAILFVLGILLTALKRIFSGTGFRTKTVMFMGSELCIAAAVAVLALTTQHL